MHDQDTECAIAAGCAQSTGSTVRSRNVAFDDPVLGHLQTMILKVIVELGAEAYGSRIQGVLKDRLGRTDHSQVYASISKLLARGFIRRVKVQRSARGGAPMKLLVATPDGVEAIQSVVAHHKAVVAFLIDEEVDG